MKKKRLLIVVAIFLIVVFVSVYCIWQNSAIGITEYTVCNNKVPSEFDGFRIVQVSDLHNKTFGKNNKKLLELIKKCSPDIICITGDIIDSRNTDISVAVDFVTEALKIAPCYFVTGNHEHRISQYTVLKQKMQDAGVEILDNKIVSIYKGTQYINIAGLDDPSFEADEYSSFVCDKNIKNLKAESEGFTVLLSHRPELFETYVLNKIDIVLSGHAHGGQFRLPYFGGVFAPGQGFMPEYDAGIFEKEETMMIVSRGIGNSIFPIRINNRPEIILIELKKDK